MNHKKYWSTKTNSGHRSCSKSFYKKKAKENAFYLKQRMAGKCIDIGCGAGELLEYMVKENISIAEAIDYSTSMIEEAKKRLNSSDVIFPDLGFDTLSYLKKCTCETWMTCEAINQYLDKDKQYEILDAFLENDSVSSMFLFDTVCPSRYVLIHQARILDYIGVKVKFHYLKKIYGFAHGLIRSIVFPQTLDSMNLGVMGYAFSPSFFIKATEERGLNIEIVSSSYYEYRYHVIIWK